MPDLEATDELEVKLFLDAIAGKYGYDLRDYHAGSMQRRVHAALAASGAPHLGELQHRLLRDPGVFAQVMENLVVPVSDLFRDPGFYKAFREEVVPLLRTYPLLKIWVAGCSTGEDVYTMAILLSEEGLYERTQIYATDISPSALEKARAGIYSAQRADHFAANHAASGGKAPFEIYYSSAYGNMAFRESLKKHIVFFQHDLVVDHVFGEMHAVLCRNVLIYFGSNLRRRVLEKLSGALCRGGFLCLGSSERLGPPRENLPFTEFVGGERIYRLAGNL